MTDITFIEREFVKEDVSVFTEFDASTFVNNAKIAIGGKIEENSSISRIRHYGDMLEKAINFVKENQLHVDKQEMQSTTKYLMYLYKNKIHFTVENINNDAFAYVKPQYLSQFTSMVEGLIGDVVDNGASKDEVDKLLIYKASDTVKRQIVKSNMLPINNAVTLVRVGIDRHTESLTDEFINQQWIPFVSKFDETYQKKITNATATLNAIRETENTINSILSSANTMRSNGQFSVSDIKKLNYVVYYGIRSIMDVVSYVTFMVIRDLNIFVTNITSVSRTNIAVSNYMASSKHDYDNLSTEAANDTIYSTDTKSLTDDLLNNNIGPFTNLADNISNFYDVGNADAQLAEVDDGLDDNTVVKRYGSTYEDIINMYTLIQRGLDVLAAKSDDYLLIFDDIISEAGFAVRLPERFSNVLNNINDLSSYNEIIASVNGLNQDVVKNEILAEVQAYPAYIEHIAKAASGAKQKAEMLQNRFENNINGEFKDAQSVNELKIFMEDFMEQFINLTNKVTSGLYSRLSSLGKILSEMIKPNEGDNAENDVVVDADIDHTDYTESVFEAELDEMLENAKEYMHALESKYFIDKALSLRNVELIIEAENDAVNSSSGTPNNTAPVVTDNSGTTANNNTNNQGSENGVVSKLKAIIETMINKFSEYISKKSGVDKKWLDENKDELANRSYNNVSLQMLPYNKLKSDIIATDIGKLTNIITAITPQSLQGYQNEDDVYKTLFPFIAGGVKSGDVDVKTQITNYYKSGSSAGPLKTVPIANGELKTFVTSEMIPYCDDFYANNQIPDLLKKLSEVTDTTITKATNNAQPNADAQKNTAGNMAEKGRWVSNAVKLYSATVLNCSRDRYLDYFKALKQLVPR